MSVCDIAYWLPYHAYYAIAGDLKSRGKQVGTRLGFITILKMISPLVGGIIITHWGFFSLYILATIIMFISIVPLLFIQDISPGESLNLSNALKKIDKNGFIMQFGDGILYLHNFIWTIVVFYLVKNYVVFGGLITIELSISTLLCIILGSLVDKGKGKKITLIGMIILGIVILLRAFLIKTIPEIIISDIFIAFGSIFYSISFDVGFYNMAKRTPNTLWFHFFGELGWDVGAATSLILSAILFSFGVPLQYILVLSLGGIFIVNKILNNNYSNRIS
jgi:MFS family permease